MTLHWWMHWFWVTAHFLAIIGGNPVPSSTEKPRGRVQERLSTAIPEVPVLESLSSSSSTSSSSSSSSASSSSSSKPSYRITKAIGIYPQSNTAVALERQLSNASQSPMARSTPTVGNNTTSNARLAAVAHGQKQVKIDNADSGDNGSSVLEGKRLLVEVAERNESSDTKKDSKITWIRASSKTNRSKYDQDERGQDSLLIRNASLDEVEDLTVLPLQEEGARFRLVLNKSTTTPMSELAVSVGFTNKFVNHTDSDAKINRVVEQQILVTAASILEGVSESTRLSRARSAFTSDFQRDQIQENRQSSDYDNDDNDGDTETDTSSSTRSAVDIAAITGSCLATVVLLSTMGSLGFIVYRRRYLNPPQALNSDKCSNPDSSGYIDDSTIRDNSEEMYSLDNDSFLNSLEAMTIQNYWTDSVKHTKL